jgi:peroxiredoxin
MSPDLRRVAALAALLLPTAPTWAQQPLAEIRAGFDADREALMRERQGRVTFQDVKTLAEKHTRTLEKWLPTATGADAANGRLLLTNIYADIGEEERARAVLKALDVGGAPALELAAAAEMATRLGLGAERTRWIDAALAKEAPFEDRMALGLYLMTRLVEVEKGEAIFDAALAVAADDEGRARVRWYRAAALREREDLEEGAYEEALDAIANEFPETYWGGIARDRRRAFDLEVGVPAIAFSGRTLDGAEVRLADHAGKVLLLDFWTSDALRGRSAHEALGAMLADYGEKGFAILGVAMDGGTKEAVAAAAKERGKTWPQLFDGRGMLTDAALRYGIEQLPDYVLIDRSGKIAAIRVFLQDDYGVRELRDAIQRALGEG